MNGEVGGGCGEATGASGDGASGDAGDADTPAPPPVPAPVPAPPVDPGGEVRLNELPPICKMIVEVITTKLKTT